MKAMILAAGRGERMRPLSDETPKPLLPVVGRPLIVHQIERLARSGFREIVINHAHLGARIEAALGDGWRFGVEIQYSPEPAGALETAGGIANALPLLGDEAFLVMNGDLWCDWDPGKAFVVARDLASTVSIASNSAPPEGRAHLVLADNPAFHSCGDFRLDGKTVRNSGDGKTEEKAGAKTLTYTGIGVFTPAFFTGLPRGVSMKLRPLLDKAIAGNRVYGEHHHGAWFNIGTPEQLGALDRLLSAEMK
jgi:MurNAc alpha-1-phosphate uridylyltransferase